MFKAPIKHLFHFFFFKKRQYARERYRNLSKEERNRKWQYGHERYKNLPEDEKQKLAVHKKIF